MEKHCQTSRREDLVLTPPAESEVCMGASRCRLLAGDASGLPGGDTSRASVSLNCRGCLSLSQKHELLPSFKMRDLNIITHGFPSATEMSNYICFIIWRLWLGLMLVNAAVLAAKEQKFSRTNISAAHLNCITNVSQLTIVLTIISDHLVPLRDYTKYLKLTQFPRWLEIKKIECLSILSQNFLGICLTVQCASILEALKNFPDYCWKTCFLNQHLLILSQGDAEHV